MNDVDDYELSGILTCNLSTKARQNLRRASGALIHVYGSASTVAHKPCRSNHVWLTLTTLFFHSESSVTNESSIDIDASVSPLSKAVKTPAVTKYCNLSRRSPQKYLQNLFLSYQVTPKSHKVHSHYEDMSRAIFCSFVCYYRLSISGQHFSHRVVAASVL